VQASLFSSRLLGFLVSKVCLATSNQFENVAALRVVVQQRKAGGHRDTEIVTYVLSGALAHRDSLGHGEVLRPGEFQRMSFADGARRGKLRLVASPTGEDGSLTIQQDARIYLSLLDRQTSLQYEFAPQRHGWLQVVRGNVKLNEQELHAGDGVAISSEPRVDITATDDAETLLFDLA